MRFDLVCIVCFFLYIFFSNAQIQNRILIFNIKQSNLKLIIQLLVSWVVAVYFPDLGNIENILYLQQWTTVCP